MVGSVRSHRIYTQQTTHGVAFSCGRQISVSVFRRCVSHRQQSRSKLSLTPFTMLATTQTSSAGLGDEQGEGVEFRVGSKGQVYLWIGVREDGRVDRRGFPVSYIIKKVQRDDFTRHLNIRESVVRERCEIHMSRNDHAPPAKPVDTTCAVLSIGGQCADAEKTSPERPRSCIPLSGLGRWTLLRPLSCKR